MRVWAVVFVVAIGCGSETPEPCVGAACGCGAGSALCGTRCIDVTYDPSNCGACGHACGDSGCIDAVCLPETLASVPAYGSELELVGDDLVFVTGGTATSSGALYRLPKVGGPPAVLYRGFASEPSLAIGADGAIVVAESSQIGRCDPREGASTMVAISAGMPVVISSGRRCVESLTGTASGLVWFEGDPSAIGAPRTVSSLETAATTPVVLSSSTSWLRDLVAVGDSVFWLEGQSVMELVDGGQPMVVGMIGGASPSRAALTADDRDIAYASSRTLENSLVVQSRSTGERTELPRPLAAIGKLAIDQNFVYAVADEVWAIDRRSRRVFSLADLRGVTDLAHDSEFLYVLHAGNDPRTSEVVRIRKPPLESVPPGYQRCIEPRVVCDEACTDVTKDRDHCGDCMVACGLHEACVRGRCECAGTICDGACVELATDPDHCGACGHDCGAGAACVAGDCQPAPVAAGATLGVLDEDAVYFARGAVLGRLDKLSPMATPVAQLSGFYAYVRDLAHDATDLYIVADAGTVPASIGAIEKVAKSGGAITPLFTNRPTPNWIATTTGHVMWSEHASEVAVAPIELVYARTNGGEILGTFSPSSVYFGGSDDEVRAVVVIGSTVYWLFGQPGGNTGAVIAIDLAVATPTATLVTELALAPMAMTSIRDELYVSGGWPDGRVVRISPSTGIATPLRDDLVYPFTLAATRDEALIWQQGDLSARALQWKPGAAYPRVIQSGNHIDGARFLDDGDRLFTLSDDGIFVMQR